MKKLSSEKYSIARESSVETPNLKKSGEAFSHAKVIARSRRRPSGSILKECDSFERVQHAVSQTIIY